MSARFSSKLPEVGTTIFTVMSRLAEQVGAVNLGQGFPDFDPPELLLQALDRHARGGKNQYAPMAGLPRLTRAIAKSSNATMARASTQKTRSRSRAAVRRRSSTRSLRSSVPATK
jgi:methionine aminotransferase